MKTILKIIGAYLGTFLLVYCIGAFMSVTFNLTMWTQDTRIILGALLSFMWLSITAIILIELFDPY